MGSEEMSNRGHYGLTESGDGKLLYVCHYTSYCSSSSRKIHRSGDGSVDYSEPTSTSSETVIGRTYTLTASIDTVTVKSLIGRIPTGTDLKLE